MSKLLLAVLGVACCMLQSATFASAQQDPVFLEIEADQDHYYPGQPVVVRIVLYIDAKFLDQQLVQMFRQPVDIPLQLTWDWPESISNSDPTASRSLVLNGAVTKVKPTSAQTLSGRSYARFELLHRFIADQAGSLQLGPASLRYAYGSRFRDDFLQGRVAEDRQSGEWTAEPLLLKVLPLPEPSDAMVFTGAIGRFAMNAKLKFTEEAPAKSPISDAEAPAKLRNSVAEAPAKSRLSIPDATSQISLQLSIHGSGNLHSIVAPEWPADGSFHCLGVVELETPASLDSRTFLYDLLPLEEGLTRIPALEFCYFDPSPPTGYRTIYSNPVALPFKTSRRATATANLNTPAAPAGENPEAEDFLPSSDNLGMIVSFMLLFPWLLVLLIIIKFLPPAFRPRWMQRILNRSVLRNGSLPTRLSENHAPDEFDPLTEFLASALSISPAAIVCPQLKERLCAAGIEPGLASQAADLHERLIAMRYGGPEMTGESESVQSVLEQLRSAIPNSPKPPDSRRTHLKG